MRHRVLSVVCFCITVLLGALVFCACDLTGKRPQPLPPTETDIPTGTDVPDEPDEPAEPAYGDCKHMYVLYDHADPGCTSDGYDVYRCRLCGDSYSVMIAALGHAYELVERSAPCTAEGAWALYRCTREGCPSEYRETGRSVAHTVSEWTVVSASDCTCDGLETGVCEVCGETITRELHANGHNVVYRIPRDGSDAAVDCLICGKDEDLRETYLPVPQGDSIWGYQALGTMKNGNAMRRLYADLLEQLLSFSAGSADYSSAADKGKLCASAVFSDYGLTPEEGTLAVSYLLNDSPMLFWVDSPAVGTDGVRLTVLPAYRETAVRLTVDAGLQAIISDICAEVPANGTQYYEDYERVMAAYRAVKERAVFNASATPTDAGTVAGFVPESVASSGINSRGYAAMISAVMNRLGYACVSVTGELVKGSTGESVAHVWNLVEWEDGWHWLDAASDDADEMDRMRNFAPDPTVFEVSHKPDTGSNALILPRVSPGSIGPVSLSCDGAELGTFRSVAAAFDAMTDPAGNYTVTLDSALATRDETVRDPYAWYYSLPTGNWPDVGSVTFVAQEQVRPGYPSAMVTMLSGGSIYLRCPVYVRNVNFESEGIVLVNNETLTLEGTSQKVDLEIGGGEHSRVVMDYSGGLTLGGRCVVGTLELMAEGCETPPVLEGIISCGTLVMPADGTIEMRGGASLRMEVLLLNGHGTLNITDRNAAPSSLTVRQVRSAAENVPSSLSVNVRVTSPAYYPTVVFNGSEVPVVYRIDGTSAIAPVILPGQYTGVLFTLSQQAAAQWKFVVAGLENNAPSVVADAAGNYRYGERTR